MGIDHDLQSHCQETTIPFNPAQGGKAQNQAKAMKARMKQAAIKQIARP